MGVIPPPPPSSDPSWNEVTLRAGSQGKPWTLSHAVFSLVVSSAPQVATEEVTREEPKVSFVSTVSSLVLVTEPLAGQFVGPLEQQPSLMAVDQRVRH